MRGEMGDWVVYALDQGGGAELSRMRVAGLTAS